MHEQIHKWNLLLKERSIKNGIAPLYNLIKMQSRFLHKWPANKSVWGII